MFRFVIPSAYINLMNPKLKEALLNIENFSGATASITLPVSRELINLFLEDVSIPKVQELYIVNISDNTLELFIRTSIPLHRKNNITFRILPQVSLPELTVTAEIISGLNKVQRFVISQIVGDKVIFEGKLITVSLLPFTPPNSQITNYLPLIKELIIETTNDKLLLLIKMEANS